MNDRLFCQIPPAPKLESVWLLMGAAMVFVKKLKHRLLLWRKKAKELLESHVFMPMDNPWNA